MRSINQYITEKLKIRKTSYNYFPKSKKELQDLLKQLIEERGNEGNFNDIDTSEITDMSELFRQIDIKNFNGDISKWDVSNVTNMGYMFYDCTPFNIDISNWDVSKVTDMQYMFYWCKSFNQDISNWNVSRVTNMYAMFYRCESFNQDISNWNISNVKYNEDMFFNCSIEENYKPKFS